MAISIVSAADQINIINGSRTASVTFSSYTPQLNDLIVLFPTAKTACTLTIPSGWVNILGGTTDLFTGSNELCGIYHFVTSAEVTAVTTTYTATNLYEATKQGNVDGIILRGVDTTTPIDSTNTWVNSAAASTTYTFPGLTGANLSTNSQVITCVGSSDTGSNAITTPTGWSRQAQNGSFHITDIFSKTALTTAGTDIADTNTTGSVSALGAAITVAFNVAGAAPASTGQFFALF